MNAGFWRVKTIVLAATLALVAEAAVWVGVVSTADPYSTFNPDAGVGGDWRLVVWLFHYLPGVLVGEGLLGLREPIGGFMRAFGAFQFFVLFLMLLGFVRALRNAIPAGPESGLRR